MTPVISACSCWPPGFLPHTLFGDKAKLVNALKITLISEVVEAIMLLAALYERYMVLD
jgi:hypothetical protein